MGIYLSIENFWYNSERKMTCAQRATKPIWLQTTPLSMIPPGNVNLLCSVRSIEDFAYKKQALCESLLEPRLTMMDGRRSGANYAAVRCRTSHRSIILSAFLCQAYLVHRFPLTLP